MSQTIYIPSRHDAASDREFVLGFLAAYPFAMVITTAGGLQISNVPTLLVGDTISWHLAAANPQNAVLTAAGAEATLVFHGPHSYISPNWYAPGGNAVPTWNFAVVHCTGTPVRITDAVRFEAVLAALVEENERKYAPGETRWTLDKMPPDYLANLRRAIVGYEMKIERIEAKCKLGQERAAGDRDGVLEALEAGKGAEKSLAELTAEYYGIRRPS